MIFIVTGGKRKVRGLRGAGGDINSTVRERERGKRKERHLFIKAEK